jgi:hypothetical protein
MLSPSFRWHFKELNQGQERALKKSKLLVLDSFLGSRIRVNNSSNTLRRIGVSNGVD